MSIKGFGEPLKDTTAPAIVKSGTEQRVHRDTQVQTPDTVSNKIVTGDIDPDASQGGTHTLSGNHIMGNGDRVEDNPSKETATKSVTDEIISGEVESSPSKEVATQSVTDQIITGETEASPSRNEGISSVTDHVINGEVASGANDKGALQSPGLPVEVTSGSLSPSASYNSKNPTHGYEKITDATNIQPHESPLQQTLGPDIFTVDAIDQVGCIMIAYAEANSIIQSQTGLDNSAEVDGISYSHGSYWGSTIDLDTEETFFVTSSSWSITVGNSDGDYSNQA